MVAKIAPLIAIVGPTASGKTSLALELARKYGGEIICADSRTIYKEMNIGTAKPTAREQMLVPHHAIDIVFPNELYNVVQFKELVDITIKDISSRGKIPFLVGGTGLYVDAVLYDYGFSSAMSNKSKENPRHLDSQVRVKRNPLRSRTLILGLIPSRELLEVRVRDRVEQMIKEGFIDEVKYLVEKYSTELEVLKTPGYRAFSKYINGEIALEEAKEQFVRGDMQLAKRQKTWFKRNEDIHWVNNLSEADELVTTFLNTK